jgi:hypothetical protein
VFIVDEALSVGDVFFQQKCARRLQEMRAAGTTMLFVSHDLSAVEALCDRVMVLHGGAVRHDGDKKTGIRLYYALGGGGGVSPHGSPAAPPRDGSGNGSGTDHDVGAEVGVEPEVGSSTTAARPGERWVREVPVPPEPDPEFPPLSAAEADALPWQPPDVRDGIGNGAVEFVGVCFRRPGGGAEPVVEQGRVARSCSCGPGRSATRRPATSASRSTTGTTNCCSPAGG